MSKKFLILLGWGWALLNGAAYALAQPDYMAQLAPLAQVIPGFDAQVAALALVPALPGLDSRTTAVVFALSGVAIALLGHAWQAGKPTSRRHVARKLAAISDAILDFAESREREDAAFELTGDAFFDSETLARQAKETLAIYERQFGADIDWALTALARFGLADPAFEAACEHPDDAEGVRILGARLGSLARQLKRLHA
jgi:hypothetical protein